MSPLDPSRVDASPVEPSPVEPNEAEPSGAEPSGAESSGAESSGVAPGPSDPSPEAAKAADLVVVDGLTVDFGGLRAVDGLSFSLARGAALGLVGESGSGKSTVASALLGLHRGTGAVVGGAVRVAGLDLARASEEELRRLRGGTAAMV
ncbi:ATP-binding cassette domain-containing protein, partial [Streptomyces sp. ECR3]|uniref:ATP-binding cassette domain-containing protein n=1 Tax=Streptomyces sp. ECR3 TaxID=3400630 RepID=UPI003F1CDEA6